MEYQHLLAGLSGGFISTLALHPIDLLKIRFAADEGNATLRPQYGTYWKAAKSIYKAEGLPGLYKGASPNILGATLSWGLYFLFYNYFKTWIKTQFSLNDLQPIHSISAGMISGGATLAITNPIWVAKTRLCLQYENQRQQYSTLRNALWTMLKKEGLIKGWYRGFLPGLFGTTHGALQFMAYDELKKNLEPSYIKGPASHVACAALSKMFAASATYPYQVVRTRLQDQHVTYSGIWDVVSKTWRRERLLGFYKGLLACLIKVTPASCVTFLVYEEVNALLR